MISGLAAAVLSLFAGSSLAGWWWSLEPNPPSPSWVAESGVLRTAPGQGTPGYLLTRETFSDFDLTFEWNSEAGGNSGIKYRFQGYWVDGKLVAEPEGAFSDAKHSTAAVYEYWPASKAGPAKANVWHSGRIVVKGLHVRHWLNGRKVVDIRLDAPEVQQSFAASPRKGSSPVLARHERRSSPIALQFHDGIVKFRNLKIRRL
jgi:hypothetical protein